LTAQNLKEVVLMAVPGCLEAMAVLNHVFAVPLILNDGHEIYQRLQAGDDVVSIVEDLNTKFGRPRLARSIRKVGDGWPPLHLEAVSEMVRWALGKLDTEDRILINWKGDDESPETVTRFELRDHELLIEFAHPPALRRVGA
jgi:hypothetical protein